MARTKSEPSRATTSFISGGGKHWYNRDGVKGRNADNVGAAYRAPSTSRFTLKESTIAMLGAAATFVAFVALMVSLSTTLTTSTPRSTFSPTIPRSTVSPTWSSRTCEDGLELYLQHLARTRGGVTYVRHVDCSGTSTSIVANVLVEYTDLTSLNFANTNSQGKLPSALGILTKLQSLALNDNPELSGTIPSMWGNMEALTRLDLSKNKGLTGELPPGLQQRYESGRMEYLYAESGMTETTSCSEGLVAYLQSLADRSGGVDKVTSVDCGDVVVGKSIPAIISQYTALTLINMTNTNTVGTLPIEIHQLTNLRTMLVGGNARLTGTLPLEWADMVDLETLDVSDTGLARTSVPELIYALTDPGKLNLNVNGSGVQLVEPELRRTCSDGLSLLLPSLYRRGGSSIDAVQHVTCSKLLSRSSIPRSIQFYTALRTLEMSDTATTGTLPTELGLLTALSTLAIERNRWLSGTLPTQLGKLSSLQSMSLVKLPQCSGPLPAEWSNMTALTKLDVSLNPGLTGEIPELLHNRAVVGLLDLKHDGSLSLSLPAIQRRCENGLDLYLPFLARQQGLANVDTVSCGSANSLGTIPEWIGAFTGLTRIHLEKNRLFGTLPTELGLLTNMRKLELWHNEFTGTLPAELAAMTALTELRLDVNKFGGSLPSAWNNMTSLNFLDVSSNPGLKGEIPELLHNKFLIGELAMLASTSLVPPTTVRNCSDGLELYLSYLARVSGAVASVGSVQCNVQVANNIIPQWIGLLTGLTNINLANSGVQGNLPTGLGLLTNMQSLDLLNNDLSGTLPSQLGNLAQLKYLDLRTNPRLAGTLPSELGDTDSRCAGTDIDGCKA